MFHFTKRKQFIALIFWIILVLIAIIKLPSISSLITNVNQVNAPQSQIAHSEKLIQAHQLHNHWGRHLNHTDTIDLIYNNPKQQITRKQQKQINHIGYILRYEHPSLGVEQIADVNNQPNGTNQFQSQDHTTEILKLRIQNNNNNRPQEKNSLLKDYSSVTGLRNYLTSSNLLKNQTLQNDIQQTKTVILISFILAGIVIGLIYRSIWIPIISSLMVSMAYLVSLSTISQLAAHHLLGFTNFTPLTIFLFVLIIGTLFNSQIYREIIKDFPLHRDPYNATAQAVKAKSKSIISDGLIILFALGGINWFTTPQFAIMPALGITILITALASLSINPIFAACFGKTLAWPGHYKPRSSRTKLWTWLTRFSFWQPILGLLTVSYFIIPLTFSYRPSVNYDLIKPVSSRAWEGVKQIKNHFSKGREQPLTIYLHNSRPFNRETTLRPLDELTTRLQSIPGIQSVVSLTQPGGNPVDKDYLNQQLTPLNHHLAITQSHLKKTNRLLKKKPSTNSIQSALKMTKDIQSIHPLSVPGEPDLTGQVTSAQKKAAAAQFTKYQRNITDFNQSLNQINTQINNLKNLSQPQTQQIQSFQKQLKTANDQIQQTQQTLNSTYKYLDQLKHSAASQVYHITPGQLKDTDFQQTLVNFTSADQKTTSLQITFRPQLSAKNSLKRFKQIKNELRTQIQGTTLRHTKISYQGTPAQQNQIQHSLQKKLIILLCLISGLLFIGLILISRSVIQPLIWLADLGLSTLSGLQITNLISKELFKNSQCNWQIIIDGLGIAIGASALELINLSWNYRYRRTSNLDWFKNGLINSSSIINQLMWLEIAITIGILIIFRVNIIELSLIPTATFVILNISLPLLTTAVGKWSVILPHSKI